MAYLIADYIPMERRRAAARATYLPLNTTAGSRPCPTTADGCCPLGVAMETRSGIPWGSLVAEAILGERPFSFDGGNRDVWDTVVDAAWEFIEDWDAGRITDLATAFGVEKD